MASLLALALQAMPSCAGPGPQGPGGGEGEPAEGEGEGDAGGEGEGEGDAGGEGEGDPAEGEGEGEGDAGGEGESEPAEGEGEGEGDAGGEGEGEGEGEGDDDNGHIGVGTLQDPIVVTSFPFDDTRDTTDAPGPAFDVYGCSTANEGGDAFVYRLEVPERGLVTVQVGDDADNGIDIDVHLLSSASSDACLARANTELSHVVDAGSVLLVADTYVSGGVPQAGPFTLHVAFTPLAAGACTLEDRTIKMVWSSCSGDVPGCEERADGVYLTTPTTGRVAKEAHLVTVEDGFGSGWPSSFTDGIAGHYTRSQQATGYLMSRTEPWAPAGEGGSQYGQGSATKPPVLDEGWYVNMYWRNKPAPGTRMIIKNPANGRAVVASAGWETGPGSNSYLGGVTEEIHHYLGTSHGGTLTFAFAVDQGLPFGPIDCP